MNLEEAVGEELRACRRKKQISQEQLGFDAVLAATPQSARNSRRRYSSFIISRVQHSQTTSTLQPISRRALMFLRSRSTFPVRFFSQNSALVEGRTRPYLQRCMCQKQP